MADLRPQLVSLLFLAGCIGPGLTVDEPGETGGVVFSNQRGVTADKGDCPRGFIPQFPGETFYRLEPRQTRSLLYFRFRDPDGIRRAEVAFENGTAIVVFPDDLTFLGSPAHDFDTSDNVLLWSYIDPEELRQSVDFGALIRPRGSSGGAVVHFRATDAGGRTRRGMFSVRPFTTACVPADG